MGAGARRPPGLLHARDCPLPTCSGVSGSPTWSSRSGCRAGEWRRGPARPGRSQPRLQPGFRFHLARLSSKGRGGPGPPEGPGWEGARRVPGTWRGRGKPWDGEGKQTPEQPPRKAQCPLPAPGPSPPVLLQGPPLYQIPLWGKGRDPGREGGRVAATRRRGPPGHLLGHGGGASPGAWSLEHLDFLPASPPPTRPLSRAAARDPATTRLAAFCPGRVGDPSLYL